MTVATETSGVFGQNSIQFLKELGRGLSETTGEEEATTHLLITKAGSIDVQHGNVASVLGTMPGPGPCLCLSV